MPLFHIVGIFFFPFGLDLSCVSLVEKTRREREQRGIGVGRERERGKDGEERERGRRVAPSKLIIILNKS